MMASTAAFRDDISGAITTGGTSTAYTLTSYQVFDTLAHLNGQMIAFVPHATNTNTVGNEITLAVDGLAVKYIRAQPGIPLPEGTLVLGTPYVVTYNHSDGVFYLHNMTNPYNVPLGAGLDFWGTTAPNSSFVFAYGQAISRTTYATLWAIFGSTYGAGNGSTTFNIPDKRGYVTAGKDNMGGSTAGRLTTTITGTTLGYTGGEELHALTAAQTPTLTSTGSNSISVTSTVSGVPSGMVSESHYSLGGGLYSVIGPSSGTSPAVLGAITSTNASQSISVTTSGTGGTTGTAHNVVQPTIIANYIIRVI